MEQLDTTARNFFEVATNYTWIIAGAALIIVGCLFALGGQQGREKAKSWIPWILIGTILIIGCLPIVDYGLSKIAF